MDGMMAAVLAELDRQGAAKDTLVLFTSDNGRPFPRCKTTVYDSGVRTPLIARWPGHVKAGGTCGRLVSAVDMAPTIAAVAGLPAAPSFQGRSFAALLTNPAGPAVREFAFSEHNWHDYDAHDRGVRSERFRYVRNTYTDLPSTPPADAVTGPTFQAMRKLRDAGRLTPAQISVFVKPRPAEELYDLDADPHELTNLAGEAKYAGELAKLRAALGGWIRETNDGVPAERTPDEFDRETGKRLVDRPPFGGRQPKAERMSRGPG